MDRRVSDIESQAAQATKSAAESQWRLRHAESRVLELEGQLADNGLRHEAEAASLKAKLGMSHNKSVDRFIDEVRSQWLQEGASALI